MTDHDEIAALLSMGQLTYSDAEAEWASQAATQKAVNELIREGGRKINNEKIHKS